MKQALHLLLYVLLVSGLGAQSTGTDTTHPAAAPDSASLYSRPNVLKTNLLGPFSLFYERQVQARQSLQLGLNRSQFNFFGEFTYFSFSVAYKFYLSKKESTPERPYPSGFYVSPYLRYANVHETNNGFISNNKLSEISYSLFGAGGVAGYQLIFRKGLALDFYLGGGYLPAGSAKVVYTYQPGYQPKTDIQDYQADLRFGPCIGYAFKQ